MGEWKDGECEYEAPDGCHYDSPMNYFWIGVLGFCGCYSEHAYDVTISLFRKLYEADRDDKSFFYEYKDKSDDFQSLQEIILHTFNKLELTEHGGSVRGGWLTEKGREIAKLVFETKPGVSAGEEGGKG